jgi:serine phosphatase RsbU (regulator of sigma subunit)
MVVFSGLLSVTSVQQLKAQLQANILLILFGVLLIALGFSAIILFAFRWKTKELSLIAFGVFCMLYGGRLLIRTDVLGLFFDTSPGFCNPLADVITYMINIPSLVFMEQVLGKGWKSSIRRLWQIWLLFATTAILLSFFHYSLMYLNNPLVILTVVVVATNLFRPGQEITRELWVLRTGYLILGVMVLIENLVPANLRNRQFVNHLEPLGICILVCCLGYIVAYRFFQNEKQLITIAHDLETARQIQAFILPRNISEIQGLDIAVRYIPMASIAGDFYDVLTVDEQGEGFLVADVSGHGIPAALIASMVKVAFVSQIAHASDPAHVVTGINQILCGKLERDFVTAVYLFIDTEKRTMMYANANHPPLLFWRKTERKIYEFQQTGVLLGQFPDAQYASTQHHLEPGDRIVLYTDGIIETTNASGEFFGSDRLKTFIEAHGHLSADDFADTLLEHLSIWSGKRFGEAADDDLTLLVIDVKVERLKSNV